LLTTFRQIISIDDHDNKLNNKSVDSNLYYFTVIMCLFNDVPNGFQSEYVESNLLKELNEKVRIEYTRFHRFI